MAYLEDYLVTLISTRGLEAAFTPVKGRDRITMVCSFNYRVTPLSGQVNRMDMNWLYCIHLRLVVVATQVTYRTFIQIV